MRVLQVLDKDFVIPIGKAKVMRPGKDVTLIAFSKMVGYNLKVADELAKEGIDCEVRWEWSAGWEAQGTCRSNGGGRLAGAGKDACGEGQEGHDADPDESRGRSKAPARVLSRAKEVGWSHQDPIRCLLVIAIASRAAFVLCVCIR